MDEADAAQRQEDRLLELQLSAVRRDAQSGASGDARLCLFCESTVPLGHRWCDPECRDGWDGLQRALRSPRTIRVLDD